MILGWYRHRDLTDFGSGRYRDGIRAHADRRIVTPRIGKPLAETIYFKSFSFRKLSPVLF